jgi:hypothetical protein
MQVEELIAVVRKCLTNNDDLLLAHREIALLCDITEQLLKALDE